MWLAYDEQLDAEVAIKVLADNWAHDDSVRRRFLEEGRFLRRVESEHVVQVHDVGELEDGRPFLVLTYADRGTLADRLRTGPLVLESAVGVVVQVGRGLQALHRRGLLHRDVKPANVLFRSTDEGERAVLSDLGLGKSLDEVSRITLPGGTPSYVAPEQAMGERLDQRADQYSLGAVAYAALTGRSPHQVDGLGAAGRVLAPPPPSSLGFAVPDRIDAAIVRALDPDRENRWPDVVTFTRELVGALDQTTHNFTTPGVKPTTTPTPQPPTQPTEPTPAPPAATTPPAGAAAGTPAAGAASSTPAAGTGVEGKAGLGVEGRADAGAGAAGAVRSAGVGVDGATGSAEAATEVVGSGEEKTAFSESNAPTVVKTPDPDAAPSIAPLVGSASAPSPTGSSSTETSSTASTEPSSTEPSSAETASSGTADGVGAAGTKRKRRRRGRWVVAAVVALVLGGGAGFGAQRYLETPFMVEVKSGNFTVRVPDGWGTVAQSDWRPPGGANNRPALRVSQDDNWNTEGLSTAGVFVGVMDRDGGETKRMPDGAQFGCKVNEDLVDSSRDGRLTTDRLSFDCNDGSTLLQRFMELSDTEGLLIQVQVPGNDRDRAVEVAESVTYNGSGAS